MDNSFSVFFIVTLHFSFPEQTAKQMSIVEDERETTEKCNDLDNDDFILFISLMFVVFVK